ncbi:hypothetical protein TrLO_g221 [Triparma laevis f. longispina]|uniref:EF-hand domain-containing protein n=1 Tax=Triparma laevis f. longispina TaxID=1714387 RepID=A0A9W7DZU8_9STRA|nr:hypothetical protein TrLO_g221 [Triparma laevis f. longispina]
MLTSLVVVCAPTEETKTLKIDRVDAVIFNIDSKVPYFFSGDENSHGPGVYVDYCEDFDGNRVTPEWGYEERRRRAQAKFGHVLKPLNERPAAVTTAVARRATSQFKRNLNGDSSESIFPSMDDFEACLGASPESCAALVPGDDDSCTAVDWGALTTCLEDGGGCDADITDYLNMRQDCCDDPLSSPTCLFVDTLYSNVDSESESCITSNTNCLAGDDSSCDYWGGFADCSTGCTDEVVLYMKTASECGCDPNAHDVCAMINDDGDGDNHDGDNHDGDNHDGDNHDGDNHDGDNHDGDNHDGDNHDDEDVDDKTPACFVESGCPEPSEGGTLDCEWLRGTMQCIEASGATCDKDDTSLLSSWESCVCDGICNDIIETVDSVISPLEWKDPYLNSDLHTGTNMKIPGYKNDAFGNFFRFDMNELQDSQWNKNPWDMFSPFTDMKYEWDETSSSCKPFVKYSEDADEVFAELVEIDGVSAECAVRFGIAEKYEKMANRGPNDHYHYWLEGWEHEANPLTMLRDTRSVLRKASGAAPPTDYDGTDSEITLRLKHPNGTEYGRQTKLTYKKYLTATSNAQGRWEKTYHQTGGKCTQLPIINKEDGSELYAGPYEQSAPNWAQWENVARPTIISPATCPRMVNGEQTPRIERNSRKAALATIDNKKFINARIVRKTSAIDGKEQKDGYIPGLAQMKGCKLYVDGLFTADGKELCTNLNYGSNEKVPIKEPDCSYPELQATARQMTATLEKMSTGLAPNDAGLLLPFIGSDSWGSCSFLIDQALTFLDVPRTIKTMQCNHNGGEWNDVTNEWENSAEWHADPCCNWMLSETMCCAPRSVQVEVPEASVDTERLANYCAQDIAQLSIAIYASKSFVKAKKDAVDPTYGCVGDRKADLKKFEVIEGAAKTCADELYGEWDQSSGKHKSTKVCTQGSDCNSKTCAAAASGETVRYCQTSMLGEHTALCLLNELKPISQARGILKDITTSNQRATLVEIGEGIAEIAGREMCTGPDGWNYDPNWLSCKGEWNDVSGEWEDEWNDETGMCDEYWCNDRDDCKTKCLATDAVCNTDPWNDSIDQSSCESTELDGKFCAMCWSGDQDCHEVSQAPKCMHNRRIWDQWHADEFGEWTQELCEALMGTGAVFKTENCNSDYDDFCTQSCEKPTALTFADCINEGNLCDTLGYSDKFGCITEKPKKKDCWDDIDSIEVEMSYCHGSDECNGFETEDTCTQDSNGDDCHFDTWTEYRHYHEHWMEVTRHNWKPFCKYQEDFDSLDAATAGCPAGTTPQKIETKEQRCKHDQMCFSSDISKSDCQDWEAMRGNIEGHFDFAGTCYCNDEESESVFDRDSCERVGTCSGGNGMAAMDAYCGSGVTGSDCYDHQMCAAYDSSNDGKCNAVAGEGDCDTDDDCYWTHAGCHWEGECHWNQGVHVNWDDDMGASGVCKLSSEAMWGKMDTVASFASNCNDFGSVVVGTTWNLKTSREFEEGKFYTEALCTAGVCDQDPGGWMGLTEDECINTESCSDRNCLGCERDWDNANAHNAPDSICWEPAAANQTHCEVKFQGSWLSGGTETTFEYCLIEEHGSPEGCEHTYSRCENMEPEQCGGGEADGVFDNDITKEILFCRSTKWAECRSEEDCVSKGFCQNEWGGNAVPDGWWDSATGRHVEKTHVCIAPEVNKDLAGDEVNWFSCESYMGGTYDWEKVEWSELGCVVKTAETEDACDAIENGVWTATQFDADSCSGRDAPQKCYNGQWFNRYNREECGKCGDRFKPLLKWSGNKWMQGEMRSMYKWKDREYASANDWVTEIDRWMVEDLVNEVINRLKEEVEGQFVKCMYDPLINSIEKIACVCGNDRDQCDQSQVIEKPTSLVETKTYRDSKQRAGKKLGTRLEVSQESVDLTAKVKIEQPMFVPPLRNDTGTTSSGKPPVRREGGRRLNGDDENSLNSAECMTVVTNDNNALVGQLVGDCITLSIEDGEDGTDTEFNAPSWLCIDTNTQIQRSDVFTVSGLGSKNGDVYKITDTAMEESGTQFCFNVTASVTACPIIYAADYADAEEDLASGECGLISDIVQEIAMKQGCKMGDSKACGWLQAGSLSHAAAIGTGIVVLLAIIGCCCSSFIGAWLHPKSRAVMKKHLNKAFFSEFDKDGDGMLDKDEIQTMLEKEFGEKFSKKQLDALFVKFDKDGNAQLDFEEYKVMMKHHKVHGHPPELAGDIDASQIELLSLKPKEASI